MKFFKAKLSQVKQILYDFRFCKRKLKEADIKIKFLNEEIERYNKKYGEG